MNIYRQEALRLLGVLRCGTSKYEKYINDLCETVQNGNLTLDDIGTDPVAIDALWNLGCLTSARQIFDAMHSCIGVNDFMGKLSEMYLELNKSRGEQYTIKNIPTTNDEIVALRHRASMEVVLREIETIRAGSMGREGHLSICREELYRAGYEKKNIEDFLEKLQHPLGVGARN